MRETSWQGAFLALVFVWLATASAWALEPWVVLKDCRLLPNESNDGDSFHVRAAGKEYVFRLYFVDAPETDDSFADRVAEQAKYFGLTTAQTTQLGEIAKKFSKEKMMARPFTVRTCMQDALGRSKLERFYAFIGTNEGDLSELLVANGMARLHGTQAKPVGLASPEREWQKLERLEREAKQQKVGGWGAPVGRMTARLPKQPAKEGADSFDAFFHPERIATGAEAETIMQPGAVSLSPRAAPGTTAWPFPKASPAATASVLTSSGPATGAKLDVNTATAAELIAIPGIGPVLAGRIIAARPFNGADEIRRVKGIGAKRYEQVRPFFIGATAAPQ